jgi:hypothetical protein
MTDHSVLGTAEEIGTDLEPIQPSAAPAPSTLFHTDDPVEVVEKAGRIADTLKAVLRSRGMIQQIGGRDHVKVEGWTTLGAMLGVVPVVTWTRKLENGWEARVEARTLDGRVIGAAEAECLRDEKHWKSRDDYALRSMAQTRAISKALGGPLRFIITLAGYEGTPAEEMPADTQAAAADRKASPSEQRTIYELASGRLSGVQMLHLLHTVQGKAPHGLDEQAAVKRIRDEVRGLPGDRVQPLLRAIRAATTTGEIA